jgi:hypothetical protein
MAKRDKVELENGKFSDLSAIQRSISKKKDSTDDALQHISVGIHL